MKIGLSAVQVLKTYPKHQYLDKERKGNVKRFSNQGN